MDAKSHYLPRIAVAMLMVALPLFNRSHDEIQPAQAALPPVAVPIVAPKTEEIPSVPSAPVGAMGVKRPSPANESTQRADRLPTQPLDSMRITSNFGSRLHPILHRVLNHDGVDLGANLNDPIHVVYDGVVTFAGWKGGYGNAVEVYHSKLAKTTLYGHMNAIKVTSGQSVAEGQIIGLAGTTGLSTGVHLHFGVENRNGGWTSPMAFLNGLPSAPPSTMIATAAKPARSYAPKRVSKPRRESMPSPVVAYHVPVGRGDGEALRPSPVKASTKPKAKSAPIVVIASAKPKRDLSQLKDRFTAAAQAAETYSKLYDEGAVSRVDRDTRVAAAKQLQSELDSAKSGS
jgi:hypothetical protein